MISELQQNTENRIRWFGDAYDGKQNGKVFDSIHVVNDVSDAKVHLASESSLRMARLI